MSLNIKNSPCFSKSYGLLFKRLLKLSSFLQPPYFHLPNIYLYFFLGIIVTDLIFKIYLHSNFSPKYFFTLLLYCAVISTTFSKTVGEPLSLTQISSSLTLGYFATQFQQEHHGLTTLDFSLTFKCTRYFNAYVLCILFSQTIKFSFYSCLPLKCTHYSNLD